MGDRIAKLEAQAVIRHGQALGKGGRRSTRLIVRAGRQNGWTCSICGEMFVDLNDINLDHIVPASHGGPKTAGNLQITHISCNCARHNTPLLLYQMYTVIKRKYPHHVIDAFNKQRKLREAVQLKKTRKEKRKKARRAERATIQVDFVGAAE